MLDYTWYFKKNVLQKLIDNTYIISFYMLYILSTNRSKQMLIVHKNHCQGFLGFHSLHGILFLVQQLQENLLFTMNY
jgi:hypothetical protein